MSNPASPSESDSEECVEIMKQSDSTVSLSTSASSRSGVGGGEVNLKTSESSTSSAITLPITNRSTISGNNQNTSVVKNIITTSKTNSPTVSSTSVDNYSKKEKQLRTKKYSLQVGIIVCCLIGISVNVISYWVHEKNKNNAQPVCSNTSDSAGNAACLDDISLMEKLMGNTNNGNQEQQQTTRTTRQKIKSKKAKKKRRVVQGFKNLLSSSIATNHYYAPKSQTSQSKLHQEDASSSSTNTSTSVYEANQKNEQILEKYRNAWTLQDIKLSPSEHQKLFKFANHLATTFPDFKQRAAEVPWGGFSNPDITPPQWWDSPTDSKSKNDLSLLDGGHLLYSYLLIMKWPEASRNDVKFPFRLCSGGCKPEAALNHSLNWREHYRPWCATPNLIDENRNGWVYYHGFTTHNMIGYDETGSSNEPIIYNKQSMVWLRPGKHMMMDKMTFFRAILNSLEKAIAACLLETNNQVGKFNFVIDASDYAMNKGPSITQFKQMFTILQDHFPNRLGMIFLVNTSRIIDFILKFILPWCTKEVRDKIKILPHDHKQRLQVFVDLMGSEDAVPDWLGGKDHYKFDVEKYYNIQLNKVYDPLPHHYCNNDLEEEFVKAMPYHGA